MASKFRCTECDTEHPSFKAASRCHPGIGGVVPAGGPRYIIKEKLKNGSVWSSTTFYGDGQHARQNVIAGFTGGPRWALDADTGAFIYGLGQKGVVLTQAPE